jgi:hypothetical protein
LRFANPYHLRPDAINGWDYTHEFTNQIRRLCGGQSVIPACALMTEKKALRRDFCFQQVMDIPQDGHSNIFRQNAGITLRSIANLRPHSVGHLLD